MTLFFRFMRPVIENGYLYIATPPLYSVKKGNKEQRYCWTDKELEQLVNEMSNGKGDAGLHIQRYKGLGEMSKEQLWETTMSPENRILRQVSIENAADADRIFSMLMGDDVPPDGNLSNKMQPMQLSMLKAERSQNELLLLR